MKNLVKNLNKEVANFGVLYTKLHSFHWLVTGKQFYRLHQIFEDLYDEVTEHFDAVAERILQLDAVPVATLKEFLELATVKEATGKENADEMIQATVDDLVLVDKELQEITKQSQELDDEVTADLLIGISASFQKHVWLLKALLK